MKMRTTQPKNNKYYIRKSSGGYNGAVKGNPTVKGADVLCNCVGYANGRFGEIQNLGYIKYQLVCNAENFIEKAKSMGLKISSVPVLGGIMVWQKGRTLSGNDGAGHVAVVEKIINANEIITSESGWASFAFKNVVRNNDNGRWGISSAYKFRGCIINPAIGNEKAEEIKEVAVDGLWGTMTTLLSQKIMKTIQDGKVSGQRTSCKKYLPNAETSSWEFSKNGKGSQLIKAIQKLVGAKADGLAGKKTVKAMQKFLRTQGLYSGKVDGIMGANTVKAWQKWLNNPTYKKEPAKPSESGDKLQPWYDAMTEQYEWSKNQRYEFNSHPTVTNSKMEGTCITFPAVALQRIGLLPKGKYFYYYPKGKRIAGNGAEYAKNRTDIYDISYPNKTISQLGDKIKKGDIVGYGNPAYHTMVYMGKDSKGKPIYNTMGHKRGLLTKYPAYAKRKISMLVRIKKVK